MARNRYLDKRSYDRENGGNERQARYDAKRQEIARHRDYMHRLQMGMQPYRMMRDGTKYEYQSAFEIPNNNDYAGRGSNQYQMKYDRRMDYGRGQGSSNANRRDY